MKKLNLELKTVVNVNSVKPISYVKANMAKVLEEVESTSTPLFVTQNGIVKGVVLDPQKFQKMEDTIAMLKLLEAGRKDVKAGNTLKVDDIKAKLGSL